MAYPAKAVSQVVYARKAADVRDVVVNGSNQAQIPVHAREVARRQE